MDLLNWIILFFVLMTVFNLRARRRVQATQVAPYEELPEDALNHPTGDGWETLRIESMPKEQRTRIILTVAVDGVRTVEWTHRLLWQLAGNFQARLQAHVVIVEAFARGEVQRAGEGLQRLLFAVDGRGWNGDERLLAVLAGKDMIERVYELGEVHQKLFDSQAPLD